MKRIGNAVLVMATVMMAACGGGAQAPTGTETAAPGGDAPQPVVAAQAPVLATQADIVRAFASSDKDGNTADKVLDGDKGNRWESSWGTDPSWIAFELKERRMIAGLEILWEMAAAQEYKIEVSDDGQIWKEVAKVTDGKNTENRAVSLNVPAEGKFVRILCEKRCMPEYGYSIHEVVLNPVVLTAANKVLAVKAEASSVQSKDVPEGVDFTAPKSIDENLETRWSTDPVDPQSLTLELESPTRISAVKINWEAAAAKVYAVEVSADKNSWQEVARVANGKGDEERVLTFAPVEAKYVRVSCAERANNDWGYSIKEIGVYK